jgi:hypothetical protein
MPKVYTKFRPWEEIEVSDQERDDLKYQGLLLEESKGKVHTLRVNDKIGKTDRMKGK